MAISGRLYTATFSNVTFANPLSRNDHLQEKIMLQPRGTLTFNNPLASLGNFVRSAADITYTATAALTEGSITKTFKLYRYGPFKDLSKRKTITAQRRQRIARRITRLNRK